MSQNRDVGDGALQPIDVECHDPARHSRKSAGHDREQFTLRHAVHERADDQCRFGLSDENVGRATQRLRAARAHRPLQDPREDPDDAA